MIEMGIFSVALISKSSLNPHITNLNKNISSSSQLLLTEEKTKTLKHEMPLFHSA